MYFFPLYITLSTRALPRNQPALQQALNSTKDCLEKKDERDPSASKFSNRLGEVASANVLELPFSGITENFAFALLVNESAAKRRKIFAVRLSV